MLAPVPWFHAFVDLAEPLVAAGLDFWTAVTGWPRGRPWPDHPEFHSVEPPDGDPYLHVQRIDGAPRVHLDLVVPAGVAVDDERARHVALGAVAGCKTLLSGRSRGPAGTSRVGSAPWWSTGRTASGPCRRSTATSWRACSPRVCRCPPGRDPQRSP